MNNYLEWKCCCANQAGLPIAVALQFLASCALILELKSSSNCLFHLARFFCCSTVFLIKAGCLSLKIFTQTTSNNDQTKNPIARPFKDSTNNKPPLLLSEVIIGIKTQQVKNLINRIFGKCLVYVNNCSGVVSHSLGTLLGNVVQILSLFKYKITSTINAIIGYEINNQKKNSLVIHKFKITAKIPAITSLHPVAMMPDSAMILGLVNKVLNSIFAILHVTQLATYKIAQHKSERYVCFQQSMPGYQHA